MKIQTLSQQFFIENDEWGKILLKRIFDFVQICN